MKRIPQSNIYIKSNVYMQQRFCWVSLKIPEMSNYTTIGKFAIDKFHFYY